MGWEYDRDFRLDSDGNPVGNAGPARGELIRAFYKTRNRMDVPTNILNGLCRSTTARIESLKNRSEEEKTDDAHLMDVGTLLKWRHNI